MCRAQAGRFRRFTIHAKRSDRADTPASLTPPHPSPHSPLSRPLTYLFIVCMVRALGRGSNVVRATVRTFILPGGSRPRGAVRRHEARGCRFRLCCSAAPSLSLLVSSVPDIILSLRNDSFQLYGKLFFWYDTSFSFYEKKIQRRLNRSGPYGVYHPMSSSCFVNFQAMK